MVSLHNHMICAEMMTGIISCSLFLVVALNVTFAGDVLFKEAERYHTEAEHDHHEAIKLAQYLKRTKENSLFDPNRYEYVLVDSRHHFLHCCLLTILIVN